MPFLKGVTLRLAHKVTAIGLVSVACVVLAGGMHMYSETAVTSYREAAENARTIFDLNSKIEIEWREGHERDFLLRNDQKLADAASKLGKALVSDVDVLHERVETIGKADLARQVEAMRGSLKQYQTHLAPVVVEKMRLGLDEKSGLEGRLRASVHDVEVQLHQPALAAPMLMLRRHENDLMLRHDVKYGEEAEQSNIKMGDSITWQVEVAILLIALGVLARDLRFLHEVGSAKQDALFDQRYAERSR